MLRLNIFAQSAEGGSAAAGQNGGAADAEGGKPDETAAEKMPDQPENGTSGGETGADDEVCGNDGDSGSARADGETEAGFSADQLGFFGSLLNEQESVRELYPSFDLRTELTADSRFARLLSGGMGLREAYEAVHHAELLRDAMAYAAKAVRENTANSIDARASRPLENGLSSKSGIVTKTNVNALTSRDILKIIKQVENGAKVSF